MKRFGVTGTNVLKMTAEEIDREIVKWWDRGRTYVERRLAQDLEDYVASIEAEEE